MTYAPVISQKQDSIIKLCYTNSSQFEQYKFAWIYLFLASERVHQNTSLK